MTHNIDVTTASNITKNPKQNLANMNKNSLKNLDLHKIKSSYSNKSVGNIHTEQKQAGYRPLVINSPQIGTLKKNSSVFDGKKKNQKKVHSVYNREEDSSTPKKINNIMIKNFQKDNVKTEEREGAYYIGGKNENLMTISTGQQSFMKEQRVLPETDELEYY